MSDLYFVSNTFKILIPSQMNLFNFDERHFDARQYETLLFLIIYN